MNMTPEILLQTIGKQFVTIELLQAKVKELQRAATEQNGSGTSVEAAPWAAKKTATPQA